MAKTTTIKVRHENGETIVSNNQGYEWTFKGRLDDATAIASIVFFTIQTRFDQMTLLSSKYEIEVTLEEKITR